MKNRICSYSSILLIVFSLLFFSCTPKKTASILQKDATSSVAEKKAFDESILLPEKNYDYNMKNTVLPYLQKYRTQGVLGTKNNTQVFWECFFLPQSKGTIVIFQGFCEFTSKFDEVTYYFVKSGYNVCRFDHRGQGNSSRDFYYDLCRVYIKDFDIYTEDAKELIDKVVIPKCQGKQPLLFAHSMGGCIGLDFLEKYPNVFSKAVLSCPMLTVNTGVPEFLAQSLSFLAVTFGFENTIVAGHKRFTGVLDFDPDFCFEKEVPRALSTERMKYQFSQRKENQNYQTTAATYGWTLCAITQTHKITKTHNIRKATLPILMFQSQFDQRVKPKGIEKVFKKSLYTNLFYYPHAEHEIYNCKNEYLPSYYEAVLGFFLQT